MIESGCCVICKSEMQLWNWKKSPTDDDDDDCLFCIC